MEKKKIIKIICISIIVIAILFFVLIFSKDKLHTYNFIKALIGYVQVSKFNVEYVEVGSIFEKTIYANTNFNIGNYMKDKGYTKLAEHTIKEGDDWYSNGETTVFITKWVKRGITVYEWENSVKLSELN